MRIGVLISGTLNTLTGGYIYDRQVVDCLRQRGHAVELIHLPGLHCPQHLLRSPQKPLFEELSRLSLDILLEDEIDHQSLILLNHKLKSQICYPIISIVHHLRSCEFRPGWQNRFYRRIEKHYLMSVDGFVFNSGTTRRAVESLVGTQRPGVIAYPGGNRLMAQITDSEIKYRANSPGPLRILFLGNLIRRKALHILLAALTNLSQGGYLLTVIGDLTMDRGYVNDIRNQIQKNKMNEEVIILDRVTDYELEIKLKENHLLAVPSYYEGFGIAYLEGMGFGLPAIGTTAGAANEIITHGHDGFLIRPGDNKALSQHLRELNKDRGHLEAMSLNARQRFISHPTWQITGEKVLDFLQSVQLPGSRRGALSA